MIHSIVFSSSSLLITLSMTCILIALFTIIVSSAKVYHLYRTDFLIALAMLILLRLALPIELPFTVTLNLRFMNPIIETFNYLVFLNLNVSHILLIIWLVGAVVAMILYLRQFIRLNHSYHRIANIAEHHKLSEYGIHATKNYDVFISSSIPNPMIIGFYQTICLPNIPFNEVQIKNILEHELQHLNNHDILNKFITDCMVIIYWWFLPIYLLRSRINLVLEMRADQKVTEQMCEIELIQYLQTLTSVKEVLSNSHIQNDINQLSTHFVKEDMNVLKYRIYYLNNSHYTKKTKPVSFILFF